MRVECRIDPMCADSHALIETEALTPAVAQAIALLEAGDADALIGKCDSKTYFLMPAKLELIRTEGREVAAYDVNGRRYALGKPLYELEAMLGARFVRISKSALVNLRRIDHVEASFNGTMQIVMKNGMEDYISRSFRRAFKERLGL